jgi:hypothetical protein
MYKHYFRHRDDPNRIKVIDSRYYTPEAAMRENHDSIDDWILIKTESRGKRVFATGSKGYK